MTSLSGTNSLDRVLSSCSHIITRASLLFLPVTAKHAHSPSGNISNCQ